MNLLIDQGNQYNSKPNAYDQPDSRQIQHLAEEQGRVRENRNPRSVDPNQYRSLELPRGRQNQNMSLDYGLMEDSPSSYHKFGNSLLMNNQYSGLQTNQNSPQRKPIDHSNTRNDKKAYGKFLLDQMKLNQGRKAIEKQKKWEEDQKMLNENNFFDDFGKSRDQIIQKYRSGLNQSPIQANNEHPTFDKINNHKRNYELYPAKNLRNDTRPANSELDFGQPRSLPPLKKKQQDEMSRNNRNFQPEHSSEVTYSPVPINYDDEYPSASRIDDRRPIQPIRPRDNGNPESHQTEQPLQNDNRNVQNQPPVREDPASNMEGNRGSQSLEIPSEKKKNSKNFMTKQEYLRALDEQVREKQLQKKNQKEREAMQDKIDKLRWSRERLLKELENKPKSQEVPIHQIPLQPKASNSHKDQIPYFTASDNPKLPKKEKVKPVRKPIEDEENPKKPIHIKKPLVLKNLASPSNQSNKINPINTNKPVNAYNPTNANNPTTTIESEPEEKIAKPNINLNRSKYHDFKDDAHGFTKNYIEEIAAVEDYLKQPIKPKNIERERPRNFRSVDSRESLESETHLVAANSSNVTSKLNLLNPRRSDKPKQTIDSPRYYSDKGFFQPKNAEDDWRSPSLQMPIHQYRSLDEKSHVFLSNNLTSSLESHEKRQNLKHLKEFIDPSEHIAKLGPNNREYKNVSTPTRVYRDRPLNSVDRYSVKEPFIERPANKPVKALNNSVDDRYLQPIIATNATKNIPPETQQQFYQPKVIPLELPYQPKVMPMELPKQRGLTKSNRGIKRKVRVGDVVF